MKTARETWRVVRGDGKLELVGALRIGEARQLWRRLHGAARGAGTQLDLDLGKTTAIDSLVVVLLVELRGELRTRGTRCELLHVPAAVEPIVRLYGVSTPPVRATIVRPGAVTRLGAGVEGVARRVADAVRFIGDLVVAGLQTVRQPRLANWRSIPALIQHAGAEATPVVIILLLLLGSTIAVQSTPSLQMLGANPMVADLVGISVTRELAPLMTAVIISGRSGAGFAAELGTMRAFEEVDALRTMGILPIPYLVFPRVIALAIIAPMLVLIGDVAAIFGGMVVGVVSLDLTPQAYLAELRLVLVASDVWTGLVKSTVFGTVIALAGCQQGLAAGSSAADVGKRATATIVVCLFIVVILDTFMTVQFRGMGV